MSYYVSAQGTFYGPLKAAKAYRRMVGEGRTAAWSEMLRKGEAWVCVAEAAFDLVRLEDSPALTDCEMQSRYDAGRFAEAV